MLSENATLPSIMCAQPIKLRDLGIVAKSPEGVWSKYTETETSKTGAHRKQSSGAPGSAPKAINAFPYTSSRTSSGSG